MPLAIIYVMKIFFDSTETPSENSPPPIEDLIPLLHSLQVQGNKRIWFIREFRETPHGF